MFSFTLQIPLNKLKKITLALLPTLKSSRRVARLKHFTLYIAFVLTVCAIPLGIFASYMSEAIASQRANNNRPSRIDPSSCPSELETLVESMLPDLASYANRIYRRDRQQGEAYFPTYFITAGRPEFEPLPLAPGRYSSADSLDNRENYESTNKIADDTRQVFITTLARQYLEESVVEIQQYHWLFLTKSSDGWRLALMFSIEGSYPAGESTSPPEESSDRVMGRAISLWLQDCRNR